MGESMSKIIEKTLEFPENKEKEFLFKFRFLLF